jgi:glycolate oxidase FAD binding subunit
MRANMFLRLLGQSLHLVQIAFTDRIVNRRSIQYVNCCHNPLPFLEGINPTAFYKSSFLGLSMLSFGIAYTGRIDTLSIVKPDTIEALAGELSGAATRRNTISLGGNFSKTRMAGPALACDLTLSTAGLTRLLKYEPRDLTISVEAGMPYRELTRILAENRQMVPLDPLFAEESTIGGVIAANLSGSRRRLYGTARDMVIGMTFATLQGKLVRTGGMVVKNVAGLDMGKLMIGSFGTLAALAVINFKLQPMPAGTRTFLRRFDRLEDSIAARDVILRSVLQPSSIDLIKRDEGFELIVQAGGNAALLDRYSREFADAEMLEGEAERQAWERVREFTPAFLKSNPDGAVVRISCVHSELGRVLAELPGPAVARAGSGVVYGYFNHAQQALGRGVIEFAPQSFREENDLWPAPGDAFAMMGKVKAMFDPGRLLNPRRLYGRI